MSDSQNKKACRKRATADKPTSITMPKTLQEAVIRAAHREDRSFSAVVRRAVEQYVAKSA